MPLLVLKVLHECVFKLHFDCGLASKKPTGKGRGKHGRRRGKKKKTSRSKKTRRQNRSSADRKKGRRSGSGRGNRSPRRKSCSKGSKSYRKKCRRKRRGSGRGQRRRKRGKRAIPEQVVPSGMPPGMRNSRSTGLDGNNDMYGKPDILPGAYFRQYFNGNTTHCVTSLIETTHLRNAPL